MSTLLPLDQIRTDGGTQPRAVIDFATVDDYMDAMSEGVKFPAVDVFFDGADYWLADGFHRVKAADQAGFNQIACNIHQGTLEDAQWYSFGANKGNGLRRTNDDKRRAVKAALQHPKSGDFSDRKIARHVGVHFNTVSEYRKQATITKGDSRAAVRRGLDGRTRDVSKIGKRRAKPEPPAKAVNEATSVPEPGGATSIPSTDSAGLPEPEWIKQLCHACAEIAACPITAKELAAMIRCGNSSNEILKTLENTDAFIRAVLAEAAID